MSKPAFLNPLLAAAALSCTLPAWAITGGTATTSFLAVGSGIQVAPDWVLTVQHDGTGVGNPYLNGYGERIVAARYDAPGSGNFPANDLTLLRLAPAATSAPLLPILGTPFGAGTFPALAVTITSAANQSPRGYGQTTVSEFAPMYDDDGPGPMPAVDVNWLISYDSAVRVQNGDSGGGLFWGHVSDSSVLLGLTSATITDETGATIGSAFVQLASYRTWIDATMAADATDAQVLNWVSAVPEPAAWALWGAGATALLLHRRRRARP